MQVGRPAHRSGASQALLGGAARRDRKGARRCVQHLLQVLDDGRLYRRPGTSGRTSARRSSTTSNIGLHHPLDGVTDEIKPDARDRAMAELRGHFRRVSRTASTTSCCSLRCPCRSSNGSSSYSWPSCGSVGGKAIVLHISHARRMIAEHGYDPGVRARPLRRYIAHEEYARSGRALRRGDIAGGGEDPRHRGEWRTRRSAIRWPWPPD